MWNLDDDNELDRISRQAAEGFDPGREIDTWKQLQQRLDEVLPQKEKRRRYLFFWLLTVGIGGGLAFMLATGDKPFGRFSAKQPAEKIVSLQGHKANQSRSEESKSIQSDEAAEATAPFRGNTNGDNNSEASLSAAQKGASFNPASIKPAAVIGNGSTGTESKMQQNTVSEKKRIANNNPLAATEHQKKTAYSKQGIVPATTRQKNAAVTSQQQRNQINSKRLQQNKGNSQPAGAIIVETAQAASGTVSDTDNSQKAIAAGTPVANIQQADTLQTVSIASVDKDGTPTAAAKKKKAAASKKTRPLAIGLVYAPDISTVKFTQSDAPGLNIGLSLQYNFSERWAVQTGAIYTKKNYTARGKDYHAKGHYWTNYVKLDAVEANCNMWDLPVNIRYNMVMRKHATVFASTGLSTYFMKKEDYEYYYRNSNGVPQTRTGSYETGSKEWVSIANISVGYERALNDRFSVQAEPFLKMPLRGVGFGNVKLNSAGVFFSIKYKPGFGKRQ